MLYIALPTNTETHSTYHLVTVKPPFIISGISYELSKYWLHVDGNSVLQQHSTSVHGIFNTVKLLQRTSFLLNYGLSGPEWSPVVHVNVSCKSAIMQYRKKSVATG